MCIRDRRETAYSTLLVDVCDLNAKTAFEEEDFINAMIT